MNHIKNILSANIQQSGIARPVQNSLILEYCQELFLETFGQAIKTKASPLYVKNKIITIACLSSSANSAIALKKPELIEKINKKFNAPAIIDMKCIF